MSHKRKAEEAAATIKALESQGYSNHEIADELEVRPAAMRVRRFRQRQREHKNESVDTRCIENGYNKLNETLQCVSSTAGTGYQSLVVAACMYLL